MILVHFHHLLFFIEVKLTDIVYVSDDILMNLDPISLSLLILRKPPNCILNPCAKHWASRRRCQDKHVAEPLSEGKSGRVSFSLPFTAGPHQHGEKLQKTAGHYGKSMGL